MHCRIRPQLVCTCMTTYTANGLIGTGRLLDTSIPGWTRLARTRLVEGDYLQLQLFLPEQAHPVLVRLAVVTWINGMRFGVRPLMMDADQKARLAEFVRFWSPTEGYLSDLMTEEIIITNTTDPHGRATQTVIQGRKEARRSFEHPSRLDH